MKIATILVVTLLVGGGGTAVAVATVGNVDWDLWHQSEYHYEDKKGNMAGIPFSVIHTDPQYNEEDGMYYAVTKLEAFNVSGKMVLIKPVDAKDAVATDTPEGIVVKALWAENNNPEWITCLLPGVHFQTMTINTRVDFSDPSYKAELVQQYGLSNADELGILHKREGGVDRVVLTKWDNGNQVIIDNDFKIKVEERTVSVAILSDNTVFEMQHIDPTEEASLKSIYDAEKMFNKFFGADYMRVIEI